MTELWMHGWALGDFFFQPLKEEYEGNPLILNRGYFGSPSDPEAAKSADSIWAHSLGLHLIDPEVLSQASELILFSSFLDFHPEPRRKSERAVALMLRRIDKDVNGLLKDFYANLFAPAPCPLEAPEVQDIDLLREDLELLQGARMDPEVLESIPRILMFHGKHDQIVEPQKAMELTQKLPQATQKVLPQAGHGYPFLDPKGCLEEIRRWRESA